MPLTFNMLLRNGDIPLGDVRLLRHKDQRAAKGRSIYELWRDDRKQFELYQAMQGTCGRNRLAADYWAAFVGTPDDRTLFVGLYKVKRMGLLKKDTPKPQTDGVIEAGSCDKYRLKHVAEFADLDGRLFMEWGPGKRTWIQRPDRRDKPIIELRTEFKEPDFPGFLNFIKPLSQLDSLPLTWIAALKSCCGIYLLTCPKTKEQYVGKADGENGFWGR